MAEVIVALDHRCGDEALACTQAIEGLAWVKVGSVLFTAEGPRLIDRLKQRGFKVFLDLKWHDIPNTVAGAVRSAAAVGVDMATVHALGGEEMLEAASSATGDMKLVAVSVLTSHSASGFGRIVNRTVDLGTEVARLAAQAVAAGVDGMVCSAFEIQRVADVVGEEGFIVVPGIRPRGSDVGDQKRVADPRTAVDDGATHLVVGRPIICAEKPGEAFRKILEEIS